MNLEHKKMHQGIWIDIFPLIGVNNDESQLKKLNKWASFGKKIINKKIGLIEDTEGNYIYKIANRLISLNVLRSITDLIFKKCFKDHKNFEFCYYLWASPNITARFPSNIFNDFCEIEFEGHKLPAPKNWDTYLKIVYNDYMTPPPPKKGMVDVIHWLLLIQTTITQNTQKNNTERIPVH